MTVDPRRAFYITGAPKVFRGKVIIGNGGTEQEAAGLLDRMVQASIPISRFEKAGLSLADLLRRVIQAHSPADHA